MSDCLSEWQCQSLDDLLALPVLGPIAALILPGSWQSIGMLGFLPIPRPLFEGFPPASLSVKTWVQDAHWSVDLAPATLTRHLDRLRSWAPVLLEAAARDEEDEPDGGNAVRMELADTVQWFDRLRKQLIVHAKLEKPARYESHILIAAVLLAFRLGSRKYMAEVLPFIGSEGCPPRC